MKITTPITLKNKWIRAAFFAVLLAPAEASKAVTHVPILQPKIIGSATFISIEPVVAKATKIPVVAEELWTIAVIPRPAKTPKNLLFPII